MIEILLGILILLMIVNLFLLVKQNNKSSDYEKFMQIKNAFLQVDNSINRIYNANQDDFRRNREEANLISKTGRDELNSMLKTFDINLKADFKELSNNQIFRFDEFLKNNKDIQNQVFNQLEKIRILVDSKLSEIQADNNTKLEKIRETVEEKLQQTISGRISESFKVVTSQLEQVYRGLGDMQKLASGVGDLKKVLSNVKIRGTMGEMQLKSILEQFLSPGQYLQNANIKPDTSENVEFAIVLPGLENNNGKVLLPVDAKFPVEDYQRLIQVYDNQEDYSKEEILKHENNFDNAVKKSAKNIAEKYIYQPVTTGFALMFVPTEGLYAQILHRNGLFESIQTNYRVTILGPTNIAAFLNSLQMGFKTLALQKRSAEVWTLLATVKSEFKNFEEILKNAQKQINQANGSLEKLIGTRTRMILSKLANIDENIP